MPDAARPLDDLLLYRLSQLLSVAGGMVIRLCEGRFGITRREWRLIATLAAHGELGSSRLAEVAQLDRARTSKAVGSLVAKGLASRTPATQDRRHVSLALTAQGHALYDELFPLVSAINTQLMQALDAPAQAQLRDSLTRLAVQARKLSEEAVLPKADRRRRRPPAGAEGAAETPSA